MNIKASKFFDLVAKIGIWCLVALTLTLFIIAFIDFVIFNEPSEDRFMVLKPFAAVVVFCYAACVIILWIEALMWTLKSWKSRPTEINMILCLFLLFGAAFAGYVLHYWRKYRG